MNYAQCGEDQNERIEFGTQVITDILRCLKKHKQVKMRHSVLCKATCIYSVRIFIVSPEILQTERDELDLPSKKLFLSLMILRCYGPQRFCADRPHISTKIIEKAPSDHFC